ncbi:homeobox protein CHOX-CAD-like isoform X1 [Branchiostoma floridae]|uniref:Homeobox protein CHOX-CAD-like isoform X1 n=2 Tax=Branchiostoma floridae TaxID=7739 RepID=A0A9J7MW25_BRAFL|nr:homeobox protein CHOX-CAD-like isoform X1 [Branchiostoma floridae]
MCRSFPRTNKSPACSTLKRSFCKHWKARHFSGRSPSAMYRHPSQGSYNLNPYNYATAHPAYPAEYGQYQVPPAVNASENLQQTAAAAAWQSAAAFGSHGAGQRPEEWDGRGYNCTAGTGLTAGPTGSCTAFPGMDYPVPVGAIQANSPAVSGVTTNSTNSQRPQHSRNPYDWMRKSNYSTSPPPVLSVRGMPPQGRKDGGRCEILGPDGKTRTKDKYRVVYSDHQRLELEKEFYSNKYITIKRKVQLANELGLSERQVKIWFQNRRAKQRKMAKRKELQHPGGQGGSDDGGGVMGEVSTLTVGPPPHQLTLNPSGVAASTLSNPALPPSSSPLMTSAMTHAVTLPSCVPSS